MIPAVAMPGRMGGFGRSMKRAPRRIPGQFGGENAGGQACHVMCRTAGGEMVFVDDTGKDAFRRLIWRMANCSGVEAWLLEHLSLLYSKACIGGVKAILGSFRRRFGDRSIFVKRLKERFSYWFNKHHGRCGTLWVDRFKSVLVEDCEALRMMAPWIDLNAVGGENGASVLPLRS